MFKKLLDLGKKAKDKIDPGTIDKVAGKIKDIDPGTVDKVAGKAGKVVGQQRAARLAEKTKGLLADEKIDRLADKAKGFVAKDDERRDEPARPDPPSAAR